MSGADKKARRAKRKEIKAVTTEELKEYQEKAIGVYEDIGKFILPVGKCAKCGEVLFVYGKSELENCLNVYCSGCVIIEDARFPKKGDQFYLNEEELGLPKDSGVARCVLELQRKEGCLKDIPFSEGGIAQFLANHPISPVVNLTAEREGTMDVWSLQ